MLIINIIIMIEYHENKANKFDNNKLHSLMSWFLLCYIFYHMNNFSKMVPAAVFFSKTITEKNKMDIKKSKVKLTMRFVVNDHDPVMVQ